MEPGLGAANVTAMYQTELQSCAPRKRQRNSVLGSLELFRATAPEITFTGMLIFLYVCENPGVGVQALADLCMTTAATTSRGTRQLFAPDKDGALAPGLGLILNVDDATDHRARGFYLTAKGRELRDRLNQIIERANSIEARPVGERSRLELIPSSWPGDTPQEGEGR